MKKLNKGEIKFLTQEVLTPLLLYSKQKKTGFCEACHNRFDEKEIKLIKPKSGMCPKCGKTVHMKGYQEFEPFTLFGVGIIPANVEGHLALRYANVVKTYYDESGMINVAYQEVRRLVWNNGWETSQYMYLPNHRGVWNTNKEKPFNSDDFLMKGKLHDTDGINMYLKTWQQCVADTEFQTLDISNYIQNSVLAKSNVNAVQWFLEEYSKSYMIESIYKIGFYNILDAFLICDPNYRTDFVKIKQSKICDALGINKEQYKLLLQAGNPDYQILQMMQLVKDYHKLTEYVDAVNFCKKYNWSLTQFADIHHINKKSLKKITRYVDFQLEKDEEVIRKEREQYSWSYRRKPKFPVEVYIDYLQMLDTMQFTLNEFALFPKDVQKAHDETLELFNQFKLENNESAYKAIYERNANLYTFENEQFVITLPRTLKEISEEGQNLHHCVGGYIDKVVEGQKLILFLRKKDEPAKSYYTMEIIGGEIRQCRGFANYCMPLNVIAFVKQFAKNTGLKKSLYFQECITQIKQNIRVIGKIFTEKSLPFTKDWLNNLAISPKKDQLMEWLMQVTNASQEEQNNFAKALVVMQVA